MHELVAVFDGEVSLTLVIGGKKLIATHQGGLFDVVGVDEPLLAGPDEDRLLGSPVVGVRVAEGRLLQDLSRPPLKHCGKEGYGGGGGGVVVVGVVVESDGGGKTDKDGGGGGKSGKLGW